MNGTVRCGGEASENVSLELQRRVDDAVETLRIPVDNAGHYQVERVLEGSLILKITPWDASAPGAADVQEVALQIQDGETLTRDIDLEVKQ